MRFHLAVTFLPLDEVLGLSVVADRIGYSGIYFSDHLFNPKDLASRYTYSKAPDGAPFWEKETAWPDPMCLISALSSVTTEVTFTTGIYIAPVRDLITVAKTVGTAAVLSDNRVRLGVGVGWCEEEYIQTGQDFHNRGKRLNDMIPALRSLWKGGWVEYHGPHYDVPLCQMNPSPSLPVPFIGGGDSEAALLRASTLCDGWVNTGAATPDEALVQTGKIKDALKRAGRENEPCAPSPTSTSTAASRMSGSPISSARRGWPCRPRRVTPPSRSTTPASRCANSSPSTTSPQWPDRVDCADGLSTGGRPGVGSPQHARGRDP